MNKEFLEKVLENQHLFEPLLDMDNRVMNSNIKKENLVLFIESLLEEKSSNTYILDDNSLVLCNGEIPEVLKFLSHVDPNTNFVLYPNYGYLGINTLLVKVFNIIYQDKCYLSQEKNYNRYLVAKDGFSSIYILGEEIVYSEMKEDFKEAKWISI